MNRAGGAAAAASGTASGSAGGGNAGGGGGNRDPSYSQHGNDYSLYQVSSGSGQFAVGRAMASMPAQPPSTSSFGASSASGGGALFFPAPYHMGGAAGSGGVKTEYDAGVPGSRIISDEMMRHLLLASSSATNAASSPFVQHVQQPSQSAAQQQQRQQQAMAGFNNGGSMKDDKSKAKGKGKGSRAAVGPGEKPRRKKKRRAFEFYWEELRGEYAKAHAHLGHNERRAIAQAQWRNVTERDKWQKMADEYNTRMLDEKYKNKPKPPVTANAFFFKEQHQLLRQQQPNLKGGAVLAEISRMWERTSDRTRWIELQQADRKRYEAEMAAYKANQAAQGHL